MRSTTVIQYDGNGKAMEDTDGAEAKCSKVGDQIADPAFRATGVSQGVAVGNLWFQHP